MPVNTAHVVAGNALRQRTSRITCKALLAYFGPAERNGEQCAKLLTALTGAPQAVAQQSVTVVAFNRK